MSDEEQNPRIVVRDRRVFGPDGTRREGVERPPRDETEAGRKQSPPRDRAREAAPSSDSPPAAAGREAPKDDPRFQNLVYLLLSQAEILLQPQAGEDGRPAALAVAEVRARLDAVIGLLEVLEEKTRGRLAPGDERFLSRALYQLRMAHIEADRAPGKASPK